MLEKNHDQLIRLEKATKYLQKVRNSINEEGEITTLDEPRIIIELCNRVLELKDQRLTFVPNLLLQDANTKLTAFIDELSKFRSTRTATEDAWNTLRQNVQGAHFLVFNSLKDIVVAVNIFAPPKDEEYVKHLISDSEDALKKMGTNLAKTEEILALVRTENEKITVAKYATVFEQESKNYRIASILWLVGAGLMILLIFGLGYYLLFSPLPAVSTSVEIFQVTIVKVVLSSVLFFILSVCVRNYRANKHNQTLNRHRQTSLQTFEAFTESDTADDQTKSAVLLAVTQTIFGHQSTGYLNVDKDSDVTNKFIEIIKSGKNE